MLSEQDIKMRRNTFEWDVEYWEIFLHNMQNGMIQDVTDSETEEVKNRIRAAELALDQFIKKYVEHLL